MKPKSTRRRQRRLNARARYRKHIITRVQHPGHLCYGSSLHLSGKPSPVAQHPSTELCSGRNDGKRGRHNGGARELWHALLYSAIAFSNYDHNRYAAAIYAIMAVTMCWKSSPPSR